MNNTKEMLTPNDYQSAIDSQNACNLSGVVFSFAQAMHKICNEANANGHGTEWKNTHPIAVMYATQIAHLTDCTSYDTKSSYMEAHDKCEQMAKGVLA